MSPAEEIITEFEYQLQLPIKFAKDGGENEGTFIMLSAPTSRNSKEVGAIRQAFMRALREQLNNDEVIEAAREQREAQEDTEESQESPSGHQVCNMIAMATKVDYSDFLEVGKKLLASGNVAMVNGAVSMKVSLVDRLSLFDLEEMLGEYITNFINTSA